MKYKTGTPVVKASVRSTAVGQGLMHLNFALLQPQEKKNMFSCHAHFKTLNNAPKIFFFFFFGSQTLRKLGKKARFLGLCPKILTWDVWGGAHKSTFIGRTHSDLDTNYSQTSWQTDVESI